jgi:pimeloyl-ACP methyl ester carboxylesterase
MPKKANCAGATTGPDKASSLSGVRPVEVDPYGPEDLIGDVLAVADALGWSRFDLVGHDWGSAVGWMTAAAFPERLRTLTAISTPHGAALSGAGRSDEDQRRALRVLRPSDRRRRGRPSGS